ncbi:uncharacterized protein LOC142585310 isoform X2 [Dermacentor variabilis]|uniref:uncharacterized protein LOC142585310 isoform X2 n=2 Tax=Dermacentor variabilis TaxID=34621 RepID=UPI003F5B1749
MKWSDHGTRLRGVDAQDSCFTVQNVSDTPSGSMEDVASTQSALTPCSICGRTFRPDALARHEQVCLKTKSKPRKVFDSSKQRIEGTEIKNAPKRPSPTPKPKPKPRANWKEKHEELIRTIRAARGEDVGPSTDAASNGSRPAVPAGYVECPSCNRNFSDRAADRHIAWCQEKKNRIPKSPASAEAVERLKARTKYKVPTPGKKNGTVSPSGSQGSKDGGSGSRVAVNRNHQRTKSSPSTLDTNGTTTNKAKKPTISRRVKPLPAPVKPKPLKPGGVMKFKEKFPNHVSSPYRYPSDDSYDPYKKADMQMRELMQGSNLALKKPRTVPGVRTGGLSSNSINGNLSDSNSFTSTNSGSENKLDEEMNYLNAKFAELSRPGFTGEFTNNWAKRMNDNAVATLSISDRDVHVSSSGSDGSLQGLGHGLETKVPYLCHQCGTMYPVTAAKYCCECGARRLGYISLYA